jgi:hypothetical protein
MKPMEAEPGMRARRSHPPDIEEVRWLARIVLPEETAGLSDLPIPVLVSDRLGSDGCVRRHVQWWIEHPEVGGGFEVATRKWRLLPRALLPRLLIAQGYDGIVYIKEESILGHVFFQRRGTSWHAFGAAVSDGFQGQGYSIIMLLDYLAYATHAPGVAQARVGRGRNSVARRLLDEVQRHQEYLGWRVDDDGWVTFSR